MAAEVLNYKVGKGLRGPKHCKTRMGSWQIWSLCLDSCLDLCLSEEASYVFETFFGKAWQLGNHGVMRWDHGTKVQWCPQPHNGSFWVLYEFRMIIYIYILIYWPALHFWVRLIGGPGQASLFVESILSGEKGVHMFFPHPKHISRLGTRKMHFLCSNLGRKNIYPLVNQRNSGKSPFLMGKSTINGHFPLLC